MLTTGLPLRVSGGWRLGARAMHTLLLRIPAISVSAGYASGEEVEETHPWARQHLLPASQSLPARAQKVCQAWNIDPSDKPVFCV